MAPPQISVSNDIESNMKHDTKSHIGFSSSPVSSQLSTDPTEKIHLSRSGVLGKLQQLEEWLDKKMGIETQGIERIHEENKIPPSMFNMFLIWWSLIIHVGSLPIGVLGPQLGLSLPQCTIAIVLGSVFGGLVTGFCASLGPKVRKFMSKGYIRRYIKEATIYMKYFSYNICIRNMKIFS